MTTFTSKFLKGAVAATSLLATTVLNVIEN